MRVLVLCYGNSCRSPMAEALMRDAARRRGLPLEVSSAGITNGLGRAHEYAVQAMQDYGLDIRRHRAREVTGGIVRGADLILTLDRTVQEELLQRFPEAEGKSHLLKAFAFGNGASPDIQDPYPSHDLEVYRRCAAEITGAAEGVLNRLQNGRGRRGG
ncbi:MAG: low molecular weight protein arginine phosphatase [Halobacteria archaeon]